MEAKIKTTRREVSQISELQKGSNKKGLPEKYKKLSIPEVLKSTKQRLRVPEEVHQREVRRINHMFSTAPSKV